MHTHVSHKISSYQIPNSACIYLQALIFTGHNATLFNLLCLAVDHYCAIAKPLTYSVHLNKRTVRFLLTTFWFTAFVFGFSDFLIPSKLHGYCEHKTLQGYCDRVS